MGDSEHGIHGVGHLSWGGGGRGDVTGSRLVH